MDSDDEQDDAHAPRFLDESTFLFGKSASLRPGKGDVADWPTLEGSLSRLAETPAANAEAQATASLLEPVYPNPLKAETTLRFTLPQAGLVRLAVYDALGRQVALIADEWQEAGPHTAHLDARDLPSGVYVAQLQAAGQVHTQRMTVVR